ncbi:MAG: hypothetical protein GXO29_05075, partial [Thermotogae bacterium]|nr:hypothetical protein [Thermotogota bacterium]
MLVALISLSVSFKEGYVQYHTVLKAVGAVPDPVSARSEDLQVSLSFNETDSIFKFKMRIPVMSFKSGNTTRDREAAKILGYPKYRYITFTLVSYPKSAISKVLNSDSGTIDVKAKLRV